MVAAFGVDGEGAVDLTGVVVDDADRENEGDLVLAAQRVCELAHARPAGYFASCRSPGRRAVVRNRKARTILA